MNYIKRIKLEIEHLKKFEVNFWLIKQEIILYMSEYKVISRYGCISIFPVRTFEYIKLYKILYVGNIVK